MPELSENQWGYDASTLGFPSISACRAIVLKTTAGLFGFHMYFSHDSAANRAKNFSDFVHNHPQWTAGCAQQLYVVTYIADKTGYSAGQEMAQWKAEAKTFADELAPGIRRMGFGLTAADAPSSAYFKVTDAQGLANLQIARWHDHSEYVSKGLATPDANYGGITLKKPTQGITAVSIPSANLKTRRWQALDD